MSWQILSHRETPYAITTSDSLYYLLRGVVRDEVGDAPAVIAISMHAVDESISCAQKRNRNQRRGTLFNSPRLVPREYPNKKNKIS